MTEVLGGRGVVDTARLVWAARAEASRLHRLEVESARQEAHRHRLLEESDARIYRCPGCGEWRYDSQTRGVRRPGSRVCCVICRAHAPVRREEVA